MFKSVKVKLTGVVPMIMHNDTLADPLHPLTKEMKKISGKRKKTDADHEEMAHIEFMAGLYIDSEDRYIIPGENIEAMLKDSAATVKGITKKQSQAAFMVPDPFMMSQYDGPDDREERFQDENCRDRRSVVVNNSRIMRTRPIFKHWVAEGEIMYDEDQVNLDTLLELLTIAGTVKGLNDYRPKFGRFSFEIF